MRDEAYCLLGSCILGLVYISVASLAATRQRGVGWNFSSRGQAPPLEGAAARLDRALQNYKETFPLFVASIVLLNLNNRFGALSAAGSALYLGARALYLPLYALDVIYVRTAVWLLSVLGIVAVLAQTVIQV